MLDDRLGGIRARYDPRNILIEPLDPAADVASLSALAGVDRVRRDGTAWDIALAPAASPAAVIQRVAAAIPPARVELRRPRLEDVFISIVSAASSGGDDAKLRAAIRDDGEAGADRRP